MDASEGSHAHAHHHRDAYRGWVRPGGRRGRWLEPFLLRLMAEGEVHGAALIARLDDLCLAPDGVDVGMAYRALREFEAEGLVESAWVTNDGPARRTYRLTIDGHQALREWVSVMHERARLIGAFFDGMKDPEDHQGG